MKRSLFLTILCLSATARAAVGDIVYPIVDASAASSNGFIAEGIAGYYSSGKFSLTAKESTRFYDSTKGWAVSGNSSGDSLMCWAHTASNMLQYWQSYYGVFYKGDKELPYGSDYTRTYRSQFSHIPDVTLPDPMRLNVMKRFIDTEWQNSAGKVFEGTDWFFTWATDSAGGGYYSDYFGSYNYSTGYQPQTATVTEVNTLQNLTESLLPAMGITKQADGSYMQTESGLIAHLNVGTGSKQDFSAHTLTCYGFTLDENGMVKSLVYADSDNNRLNGTVTDDTYVYTPTLEQAYVKVEDGKIMLYEDAELQTPWQDINSNTYHLGAVTGINTPESLRNMLAEYSSADEAMVWNGNATEWKAQQVDTNTLPDPSTGWDILVDGDNIEEQHKGYYHSYAADNRAILLDAHGMNNSTDEQAISVVGTVTPGTITVGDGGRYTLRAGDSAATIAGSGDVTIRQGGKLTSELALGSRAIKAENGGTFSYALSADHTLTATISGDSGSTIQFRNSSASTAITYSYDSTSWQTASATANAIKGKLIVGAADDRYGVHLDLYAAFDGYLTLEELTLYSASSINTVGAAKVTGVFSALRVQETATTFNTSGAAAAAPLISADLDLSSAHTVILETSVDLQQSTLRLNQNTPIRLTLSADLDPSLIYETGGDSIILFTNVSKLNDDTTGDWKAADYFDSAAITDTTRLVLDSGTLSLRGIALIPEPSATTLTLLSLTGLALSRRRRRSA